MMSLLKTIGLYNKLGLIDESELVVPSHEFHSQTFHIDGDMELEISGRVKQGQDMYVAVIEKGGFEWAMQEGEDFNPVYQFDISDTSESVVFDIEAGDYILYFQPVSESGPSSRIDIDATVYRSKLYAGFDGRSKHSLNPTLWMTLIILSAPFGFLFSITALSMSYTAYSLSVIPLLILLYLDARATRKVSEFPHALWKYMVLFTIPVLNIAGIVLYIKRRSEARK